MLATRDRLLLAFADLTSHGIIARPAMVGDAQAAHREIAAELLARYPNGRCSYVFWLLTEELLLPSGSLSASMGPTLHYSNQEDVPGIEAICRRSGLELWPDQASGTLRVRLLT